ncbi:hypothetical protein GCM10007978_05280 [Shewanella hanedai]|jgi:hypothetical protein|uniref:Histidine kinase n=1 Tax=Shewanella hanedai TaxID=25 RepID=A0A553JTS5_SHEHA|nr:hypothetical protein [Shewanella hanedai]TRY15821.1 hypothetical protein FN961_02225 [Shewanella hanedai]GGI70259.1 hypothetical protein GCM10007978_05280 [Shewanella hanedai]
MKPTTQSLTTDTAIRNEANRVINALNHSSYPIEPIVAESVIESLQIVAESLDLSIAKTLNVRLIAIRNNIHVNQIQRSA